MDQALRSSDLSYRSPAHQRTKMSLGISEYSKSFKKNWDHMRQLLLCNIYVTQKIYLWLAQMQGNHSREVGLRSFLVQTEVTNEIVPHSNLSLRILKFKRHYPVTRLNQVFNSNLAELDEIFTLKKYVILQGRQPSCCPSLAYFPSQCIKWFNYEGSNFLEEIQDLKSIPSMQYF